MYMFLFFFFKQKTAYEMRISDWSSDVCSSDLAPWAGGRAGGTRREGVHAEGLSFKKACCPPNSSDPRSPGAAGNGKSIEAGLIPLVSSSSTRRGEDQHGAVAPLGTGRSTAPCQGSLWSLAHDDLPRGAPLRSDQLFVPTTPPWTRGG